MAEHTVAVPSPLHTAVPGFAQGVSQTMAIVGGGGAAPRSPHDAPRSACWHASLNSRAEKVVPVHRSQGLTETRLNDPVAKAPGLVSVHQEVTA